MQQLNFGETPIKTVVITPTKEMPLDIFKVCHRLAYYLELMERTEDGLVIWDETLESIYNEDAAEAEYFGLQNDWFVMDMELPKKFFDEQLAA